jgi:hypothetical protein
VRTGRYVGSGFSRILLRLQTLCRGQRAGRAITGGRPYALDICTRRTWDPASAGFAAASDPMPGASARAGRPQGVAPTRSISARGVRGIRLQPDLLRLQTLCRGPARGPAITGGRPYALDICTRYPSRTWDSASAGFAAASAGFTRAWIRFSRMAPTHDRRRPDHVASSSGSTGARLPLSVEIARARLGRRTGAGKTGTARQRVARRLGG